MKFPNDLKTIISHTVSAKPKNIKFILTQNRANLHTTELCINRSMLHNCFDYCRFSVASLSKFAICLSDQHLQHSPLMGRIASILDQRLSSIDDARLVIMHV